MLHTLPAPLIRQRHGHVATLMLILRCFITLLRRYALSAQRGYHAMLIRPRFRLMRRRFHVVLLICHTLYTHAMLPPHSCRLLFSPVLLAAPVIR